MIRENLAKMQDSWHKLAVKNGHTGISYCAALDYLLERGQEFKGQPLPKPYRQGVIKQCYWNAWKLVRRSKTLRYVEGQCIGGCIPFPIEHAWAIDLNGGVIDPTLRNCEEFEYLGVVFGVDELPKRYNEIESVLQARVRSFYESRTPVLAAPCDIF